MPAARAVADLLVGKGIDAEAVALDATETASRLRAGTVDAVVGWSIDGGAAMWASRIQCPQEDTDFAAGNLSGLCLPSTRGMAADILSGRIPAPEARGTVSDTLRREAVWVPVLSERRIMVLGTGIIGPDPDLQKWSSGVAGAAQWTAERTPEETDEPATETDKDSDTTEDRDGDRARKRNDTEEDRPANDRSEDQPDSGTESSTESGDGQ